MSLIEDVYRNKGNDGSIHKPLVTKTAKELIKPVDEVFGQAIDYDSPDFWMREALKKNVWKFSVAKNYNDCVRLSNLLLRPDGSVRPWNEFKREALFVSGLSNRYLKTEYDTIIAGAQMSRLWQEIQRDKHIFPYVQFDVVMDKNTSDICEPLHRVIMSVDDPRLIYFFPPNHFNCRTTVRKLRSGIPTVDAKLPEIPEAFQNNVGMTGEIFTDKNAYIENTPQKYLTMSEEFAKRWKKFEELQKDINYYDIEFGKNAGLKATHKDHNFHPVTGKHEKAARDLLFNEGNEIIMLSERADIGVKTPDGLLNDKISDIKTVLGSNGTIGKNNIIDKINEGNTQNCDIVILQFPKESVNLFDKVDLKSDFQSSKRILKSRNKEIVVKEVWVILDDKIKKFSF